MKTRLLILGCLLSSSLFAQSTFLEKEWVGQLSLLGQSEYIRILNRDGQTTFRLPYTEEGVKFEFRNVKEQGKFVHFSIKRGVEKWQFEGERKESGQLEGILRKGGLQGTFYLHPILPIDSANWRPYLGDYRLPSGEVFKVWDRFNTFRIHSPLSGEVSRGYKIGEDLFYLSTGEEIHFSGQKNGQLQTLEWRLADGQKKQAIREETYTTEKVVITTEVGDTIGASILIPKAKGKHPACIVARGAGNFDRSLNLTDAEILASHGIATLIYDNYGHGLSKGRLLEKTFVDKQKLVIELFKWLQKHPRIDPLRIGLSGGSQGARIAAMAAHELPEVAFLFLRAYPMETRKDQQLYAIGSFLRQRNVQEEAIAQAMFLWDRYFDLAYHQKMDTAFVSQLTAMRSQHPHLMLPTANADTPPVFPQKEDIYNATRDYLSNIKCPVLSMHGSLDDRVPPHKSIFYLKEGLKANGNDQLTVLLYKGANHSFQLPGFRIAPGFFMNGVNWIREVLIPHPPRE